MVVAHTESFPRVTFGGDFGALFAALNSRRGNANYVDFLGHDGNGIVVALDLGLGNYRIDPDAISSMVVP